MRTTAKSRPETINDYVATVPEDQRAALQKLRRTIRAIVPDAQECISYGLPAFRFDGRVFAWLGAAKNHCSFFPGGIVEAHANLLKGYDTSKGTIRFQPHKPLPAALVRKLVKARIAANADRQRRSGQGASRASQKARRKS
jgi:uncharacterized protein YdhG (YjbR/CyaY superfamily)